MMISEEWVKKTLGAKRMAKVDEIWIDSELLTVHLKYPWVDYNACSSIYIEFACSVMGNTKAKIAKQLKEDMDNLGEEEDQ